MPQFVFLVLRFFCAQSLLTVFLEHPPPPGLGLDASNGGISQIFPRVINWNNLTVNTGFLGLRVGDPAVVHITQKKGSFNPATPTPNR